MASPILNVSVVLQGWQRLAKPQQLAVLLVGGAAIILGIDLIVLRPLRHGVRALRHQVHETEQRLIESIVSSQQTDGVNRAFDAYSSYLAPTGSSDAALADVLSEVEHVIQQSGLTLINLKPASPQAGKSPMIQVMVEGEASPEQLVRALDLIQRSPKLLKVTDLTVRVTEDKTLRTSLVISKLLL